MINFLLPYALCFTAIFFFMLRMKRAAEREEAARPPSRSDSDRLEEIAARLEKIEQAILNGRGAASR